MLRHEASLIMKLETCRRACLKLKYLWITYHKLCDPSSLRYAPTGRRDRSSLRPAGRDYALASLWQDNSFWSASRAWCCFPRIISRRSRLLQMEIMRVIPEKLVLTKVGIGNPVFINRAFRLSLLQCKKPLKLWVITTKFWKICKKPQN